MYAPKDQSLSIDALGEPNANDHLFYLDARVTHCFRTNNYNIREFGNFYTKASVGEAHDYEGSLRNQFQSLATGPHNTCTKFVIAN